MNYLNLDEEPYIEESSDFAQPIPRTIPQKSEEGPSKTLKEKLEDYKLLCSNHEKWFPVQQEMSREEFMKIFWEMSYHTQTITRFRTYDLDKFNKAESYTCYMARKTCKNSKMFKEKFKHIRLDINQQAKKGSLSNPILAMNARKGKVQSPFWYFYTPNLTPSRVIERLFSQYCLTNDQFVPKEPEMIVEKPNLQLQIPSLVSEEESKADTTNEDMSLFQSPNLPIVAETKISQTGTSESPISSLGEFEFLENPGFLIRKIKLDPKLKKKFDNLVNDIKREMINELKIQGNTLGALTVA